MDNLLDKVVLVTGAASGIGQGIALAFAARGAKVIMVDRDIVRGREIADTLSDAGSNALFLGADVTSEDDVRRVVAAGYGRYGGLDILVNSAGIAKLQPTDDMSLDDWRATISVNLDATFLLARECIRIMKRHGGGSIVNIASMHGHVGFANHAAYTASKGGVVNFTRTLAIEFGRQGIRVNAVCPGVVLTPLVENAASPELLAQLAEQHPIGRLGRVDEIAKAALFLASDDASFITGASLFVDGGYTAQ
jgi:NAD(P)-dependent dehydrogenase (short-subunit alcohol dehydrogenase family)